MSSKPDCKSLAETLGALCIAQHDTVATAESCTGGMIGAALTAIAGASAWFRGGVITYDNQIKSTLLRVPPETITLHGAVSEETVSCMATNAAQVLSTTCAIAVSGIAGPDGGTALKPVGLVYIGIHYQGKTSVYKNIFSGDREAIREKTVSESLRLCIDTINKHV